MIKTKGKLKATKRSFIKKILILFSEYRGKEKKSIKGT